MVATSNIRIEDGNGIVLCTLQILGENKYYDLKCFVPSSEFRPNRVVYLWFTKTTIEANPKEGRNKEKNVTTDVHVKAPHRVVAFYRHHITEERILELQPID